VRICLQLIYIGLNPPWLSTNRFDWVNTTEPTDTNPVSFGCALAFIFYLNTQLGFTISQIIAAGR